MLDHVVELADRVNVRDRIVIAHADLGEAEWPGTRELVAEHAAHYGLRLEVVRRVRQDGEVDSLLEYVRRRGKWPSSTQRWCTSDFKRDPIGRIVTKLSRESGLAETRILNCLGLRAEESPARKKKPPFERNKRSSSKTRIVDNWLPIHDWTLDQVWSRIRLAGTRHHWAYDIGMPRLSCRFCIFAPKAALILSGQHNRDLLNEYVRVEKQIGHRFRKDLAITEIQNALNQPVPEAVGAITDCWNM
jgi:3'-phosphoadenosine 5'-phosphosulfate sulfotransferase (PAPS reductase)/FAD synthetase